MLQRKDFTWAAVTLALTFASLPVLATNTWANYHWPGAVADGGDASVALDLGNNVNLDWENYLAAASLDWSDSAVIDTSVVPGSTNARRCKAQKGNVQVCNNTYGNMAGLVLPASPSAATTSLPRT